MESTAALRKIGHVSPWVLAQLMAALVTMSCLSQFYRVSNSVIAPELMRELGLSSEQLGLAGGA